MEDKIYLEEFFIKKSKEGLKGLDIYSIYEPIRETPLYKYTRNGIEKTEIGSVFPHTFIEGLKISDALKAKLKAITPFNYTGV